MKRFGNSEKKSLTNKNDKGKTALDKLKDYSENIGYGQVIVEIDVHDKQIRQIQVIENKPKFRDD